MNRRSLLSLLAVLSVVFVATSASAAGRGDAAAKKKIDLAVTKHYLATEFEKAETVLTGAISGCKGQCSPAVVAKAWMYVGVVRGSGKNDQKGARDAFANALGADPKVALDEALATQQTKKTFAAAQKDKGKGGGDTGDGEDVGEGEGGGGTMECTPKVTEVETRRPIPISCTTSTDAKKVDLHYKAGSEPWKTIKMKRKQSAFQATIPCKSLQRPGSLRFYVRAKDSSGDPIDSFGKKANPSKISIVKETDEEPPTFPDKEAPARCKRSDSSSAEAECSSSDDCEGGMACTNGACTQSQTCDVSADCSNGGKCVEGKCEAAEKKAGPFKENWIGVHLAYDFAIVGGSDVCSQESQRTAGFACFYKDTEVQYRFNPQPSVANKLNTGIAPATYRALLSFDRVLGENITLGLRAGYAFHGGPPTGKSKDVKFLPYHGELRFSYWLGDKPFSKSGFRPYVGAEAGAAQVDAKLSTKVGDCGGQPDGSAPSTPKDTAPKDPFFSSACSKGQLGAGQTAAELDLDVYKKLGQGFLGIHGGIVYALSPDGGFQLNVNIMQMLPTRGQVIEPSLGYVFGL